MPRSEDQVSLPVTSAASHFQSWLDAANSFDPMSQRMDRFLQENYPALENRWHFVQDLSHMRTGGFDLKTVEENTETRYRAVIQDRALGAFRRVVLEVERGEPGLITRLEVDPIPLPPGLETKRLTEHEALNVFETRLEDETAADRFSGAVLVAKGGTPLFSGAYGRQDRENNIPNRTDTRFMVGSMSKIYTAVSVLQLVQQGRLGLSEPIGRYLPDYPDKKAAQLVTPHHLLTHTSGVCSNMQVYFANLQKLKSLDEDMVFFGALGLEFEPGSKWAYTNFGFELLGLLVERVSQQDFHSYVIEHIFRPAEMSSAGYERDESARRDSIGYGRTPDGTGWAPVGRPVAPGLRLPAPAGGGYATVEDFHRFANAVTGHRLLDPTHTALMAKGQAEAAGLGLSRMEAYGWEVSKVGGIRYFARSGSTNNGNGELRVYSDSGYVIVVLANLAAPAAIAMTSFIGDRLPQR